MLRYGFYNSVNGDRKYEAEDMGRLFDGIIKDGVFYSVGDKFRVEPAGGMRIAVGTGRAWFDRTWSDLDETMFFEIPTETVTRTYYVALLIDKRTGDTQRKNTIELLTYTEWQAKQGIANLHPYALAKIDVPANVTVINSNMITNYVGGDEEPVIPYVISPVQSIDLGPQIEYWEQQMNAAIDAAIDEYFDGMVVVRKLADIGGGYAVCNTAEATLAKTAEIEGFVPTHGGIFCIKFTNAVTSSATLNIGDGNSLTGQKPIYYKGVRIPSGAVKAGNIVTFTYDSTTGSGYTNGRYHVISIDEDEPGSAGADNVVYETITNLQASVTPGIIYDAIVTQEQNLWYCLVDSYSKLTYTLQKKPESASSASFFAFDASNNQISVATLNAQGAVTFTAYPLSATPTWNSIKPGGGIPETDLDSSVQAKLNSEAIDNVVYITVTNQQANITPEIIYNALVRDSKNLWYCIVDSYTNAMAPLMKKPTNTSSAYFAAFDDLNQQIVVYSMNSTGAVTLIPYPLGSNPTWNSIKPSGGVPFLDLASDVQSALGSAITALQPPTVTTVTGNTPSISAPNDNTIYDCTGSEITMLTVSSYSYGNSFTVIFNAPAGASAPTVTFDGRITMPDDFTAESNKHYEINVDFKGYATVQAWTLVD